jgi:hypothetical protein
MNELARIFSLFLGSFPARSLRNKYFSGQGREVSFRRRCGDAECAV